MKNIVLLRHYQEYVEFLIEKKQAELDSNQLAILQQELSRCKYERIMMKKDTIEFNSATVSAGPFYHWCVESGKK